MLADNTLIRGTEVVLQAHESLAEWVPVALPADPLQLWWRHVGGQRFCRPFFQDELAAQPAAQRRVCRTSLAALDNLPQGTSPCVLIFHVSRCGSTLLTQMLATVSRCIVMSEPPVLDAFFRLHHHHPERSGGVSTLRRLVNALGQRRHPAEQHLVLKFDSWHLPWMPLLREAFPHTPIVMLYREPGQVLASHRRQRGPQMVPGLLDTTRLRPDTSGLAPGDLDGYTARMLDAMYGAALDVLPAARPLLLDYRQLPDVVWTDLLSVLGWDDLPQAERVAMRHRAGFHSKHANAVFAGDAALPETVPAKKMDRQSLAVQAYMRLEAARISCATGRCLPCK